ncbi:tripartite motif-containing protein 40 [Heterocephalus glaber]|uniref:Tripartite motif-containing protein 40 n=1 Tax=Heterocephalus glaber TaxID=10181 RepID=A0AAX6T0Z8_HETGA|nr:tripartite motif-containing protein 40 [Heterocephalus glaber]
MLEKQSFKSIILSGHFWGIATGFGITKISCLPNPFEGVLGEGYLCRSHQKRVCRFREESKLLPGAECLESPAHQAQTEPTREDAISHCKERLNRGSQRLRKDIAELQRLQAPAEKLRALQVQISASWSGCRTSSGARRLLCPWSRELRKFS